MSRKVTCVILLAVLSLTATPAFAYVGPGAGLSMLGALWGLLVAVVAALGFVVMWPLRRYFRKGRAQTTASDQAETGAQGGAADGEEAQQAPADGQGRS